MSDRLNNILKEWAAQNAPDDDHLRDLAAKIHRSAVEDRVKSAEAVPAHSSLLSRLLYASVGAVTALLLVAIVTMYNNRPSVSAVDPARDAQLAGLQAGDIETGRRLFGEMERLFSDELRWVAETNGDVNLGLESLHGPHGQKTHAAVVRLAVVGRGNNDRQWRTVWSSDVLLRGEEMVEVVPDRGAGSRLALWVYPLSDGKVAIDTDLALDVPVRLAARRSLVVDQKVTSQVASVRDGDIEYRLLQSVAMLD